MKHRSIGLAAVVLGLIVSSGSVLAVAPEPVVNVEDLPPPVYDPTEPYRDDQGGRCPAGNSRMSSDGVIELNRQAQPNGMPGPVVAVDPAPVPESAPCLADMRLDLVIEAPGQKKPDGADADLDGMAVPRPALEGGFEVTLPAQDRTISFTHPGENWELKSTVCSCSGWTTLTASGGSTIAAAAELASYPQPVVAVEAAPTGSASGCAGAAPYGVSSVAARPVMPTSSGLTERATYPGPVVAVEQAPRLQPPRVDWDEAGTVTITDPDQVGGTFTCVWTVELVYGQLDIETVTKPRGEEERFRYEVEPTGGQPDASAFTVRGGASERLRWGPWMVDIAHMPEGWEVEKSGCREADISLLSRADGSTATVGLDPDDAVVCKFEFKLLAPRPGRWEADNKAGTLVCSKGGYSIRFPLDDAVDFGRLQVRDEGDTLIARGGGNTFTFRRDRDDPLRYVGKKRFRQQGITLDFDIRLNLRSETRMTGTLRMKGSGRGAACSSQRRLTLTHASAN